MAIVGQTPDELFEKLYRQDHFRGYAFSARDPDSSDQQNSNALTSSTSSPETSVRRRRSRLQTRLAPDKLESRLAKIFREERTLEEEQGLNTLYLALGFLKWFESDETEESFAPLVLIPVTMIRVGGEDGYLLRGRDDEIVANISLREKLRTNFGIQLPEFPDDDQWKPSDYLERVARKVKRQPRWSIDRDAVGLGFFTFSKFMMWRDLDTAAWPENSLLDHPLINSLLGASEAFETLPPIVPDDEPIDQSIDLSRCVHVVNADSSQTIVIEEARGGRSLVVQGPPGTGKSQTITNIVASAVHSGKTVLFVAEKTAALEVVYDRLVKAGLGVLCLEMHSRKAQKREIFKSLEQAIRFSGVPQFDEALPSSLASCRDRLNQWSKMIHNPISQTGRTAFDAMGMQLKLRAEGVRLLDNSLDEVAHWTAAELSSAQVAVNRAAEVLSRLSVVPREHPWFATNVGSQSPFDLDRLIPKLRVAATEIETLAHHVEGLFRQIGENREPCLVDAFLIARAFRHVAAVPDHSRHLLAHPTWVADLSALESGIEEGRRLTTLMNEIEQHFSEEAWTCNTAELLLALRVDGPSFFRRLGRRYRLAQACLRNVWRTRPPKNLKDRIALLEALQRAQDARREFTRRKSLLSSTLGSMWADQETPWADARLLAAWVRCALSEVGGVNLLPLAARVRDLRVFADTANSLEPAGNAARQKFETLQEHIRADLRAAFGIADYDHVPITQLADRLATWLQNSDVINEWVQVRDCLAHLRDCGLGIIADRLVDGSINPNDVRPMTELLIAESLWRKATSDTPELTSIDGGIRSECVSTFRDLDQQRIRAARHEVLARYLDQRPTGYAGQMGVIRAEIDKKRGHRAIRKLIIDAGSAMLRLKPVFLMSPLSAAQFLSPGRLSFDLVVIDEASQVAPEDALGAIARAKQIVVVGDDKQLPPTNFFKTVNAGDDDSGDDAEDSIRPERPSDFESILTLSRARGVSERMLAWHYRSKHPSLIALSNEECYANRLLLPPSPLLQTSEFGLSLVKTPRGHYDRGGTSRDLVQAEQIAKAVAQQIKKYRGKSLGIACLSAQQRDAVDDMIDRVGIRSDVEGFMPKGERLFVKNLEAVQGDERDVIFISVGYGVSPNQSRPFLNFGPVSRDGGERRLNVLASRAREKCVVFSSITAADIPADSEVRGTRMLRALLNFAETGKLSAGTLHSGGFDSPFEEAVARAIREAGFHCHAQVGVSSFRIDLGVIDPSRPGEYILGVECDGATYHSARSARDRDRLRQEVLEELGWRLHRIWSTDWFRNPNRECGRLLAAINAARDKAQGPKVETIPEGDQRELKEPESEIEAIEDDDPIAISNTVPYKQCVLRVPRGRDLLDLSVPEIARIALEVVEGEGPVHTEEVARRIREAFSLQRTGGQILAHVRSGLKYLSRNGSLVHDGEFWSAAGRELQAVRNRRNAELPLRRASMIAPNEYQLAISTIISDVVAISREDLLVETARLFGFGRTGPDLKEAIDRQTKKLVNTEQLHLDGDVLRLGVPSVPQ